MIEKYEFIYHYDTVLNDKPELKTWIDSIEEVIEVNKYKLKRNRFSFIGDPQNFIKQYYDPRDDVFKTFDNWNEFEMNIQAKEISNESDIQYLLLQDTSTQDIVSTAKEDKEDKADKENKIIRDLSDEQSKLFVQSLEEIDLITKASMTPENYAIRKLIKEMDKMY